MLAAQLFATVWVGPCQCQREAGARWRDQAPSPGSAANSMPLPCLVVRKESRKGFGKPLPSLDSYLPLLTSQSGFRGLIQRFAEAEYSSGLKRGLGTRNCSLTSALLLIYRVLLSTSLGHSVP